MPCDYTLKMRMTATEASLREQQRHGAHPHKQDLGGVLRLDVLVEGQQGGLAAAAARGADGDAHEVAQVQVGHHHLGHRPIHPLQHLPPVLLRLLLASSTATSPLPASTAQAKQKCDRKMPDEAGDVQLGPLALTGAYRLFQLLLIRLVRMIPCSSCYPTTPLSYLLTCHSSVHPCTSCTLCQYMCAFCLQAPHDMKVAYNS